MRSYFGIGRSRYYNMQDCGQADITVQGVHYQNMSGGCLYNLRGACLRLHAAYGIIACGMLVTISTEQCVIMITCD